MLQHTVMDESTTRLSDPKPEILISQGYVRYESGIKVFVRVFFNPYSGSYVVKVKLPRHKTLHVIWHGSRTFRFEGEWLVFNIMASYWAAANPIRKEFKFVWFTD